MKIKDVFEEISVGYNISNTTVKDKYSKIYKTLHKDSIQYTNIIDSRLIEKIFTGEIKKKYFIQPRDILIFVKKPYRVGTYTYEVNEDIVIPNNFIILRGINIDKYSYIFIANYLEIIVIKYFLLNNNFINNIKINNIYKIKLI